MLENVRAYALTMDAPFQRRSGPVPLVSQQRVYALSENQTGRIVVAAGDMTLEMAAPGTAWLVENDLGLPPWAGFVHEETERLGAGELVLTLQDAAAAILADTRTPKSVSAGPLAAGELVRRLLSSPEAWAPTRVRPGQIEPGPTLSQPLQADKVLGALRELVGMAAGADYWLEAVEREAVEFVLHWGAPGQDRRQMTVLREGIEILDATLTRSREGLMQSVLVVGGAATFEDRDGVEVTANGAIAADVRSVPAGKVLTKRTGRRGAAGRRQEVIVRQRAVDRATLEAQAQAVLRRKVELADHLELVLSLASTDVRTLRPGDVFRVVLPSLQLGTGFDAAVRLRGMEPHEESGRMPAVVSIVQEYA